MKPIDSLIENSKITEIIIHGPDQIWFEDNGVLQKSEIEFLNTQEYQNFKEELLFKTMGSLNIENPFHEAKYKNFRITMIDESITKDQFQVLFRRNSRLNTSLDELNEKKFVTDEQKIILQKIIDHKMNFLIIGSTGSGKTTLTQALLNQVDPNERIVLIEDTQEISLPNKISSRLMTRPQSLGGLSALDQDHLLKRALRMRPDRLVVGEMRSSEAKDFLMALSTGHRGSLGTLHASNPHQALLRLEMLVQMGAPQWGLMAIRQLIRLSLDVIVCIEKKASGERRLQGIYKISSLEETGFLIENIVTASELKE
jgi:pilus assembly protein CpaF